MARKVQTRGLATVGRLLVGVRLRSCRGEAGGGAGVNRLEAEVFLGGPAVHPPTPVCACSRVFGEMQPFPGPFLCQTLPPTHSMYVLAHTFTWCRLSFGRMVRHSPPPSPRVVTDRRTGLRGPWSFYNVYDVNSMSGC